MQILFQGTGTLQVEEAKGRELDDVLQQMQRLEKDATSEVLSGKEREAALAADVRHVIRARKRILVSPCLCLPASCWLCVLCKQWDDRLEHIIHFLTVLCGMHLQTVQEGKSKSTPCDLTQPETPAPVHMLA